MSLRIQTLTRRGHSVFITDFDQRGESTSEISCVISEHFVEWTLEIVFFNILKVPVSSVMYVKTKKTLDSLV